jgi:hypothetical protein
VTAPRGEPQETGRIFYEAFAAGLGWQFRDTRLPAWPDLYPAEQDAFRLGAHEVMQKGWAQAQAPAPAPRGRHER